MKFMAAALAILAAPIAAPVALAQTPAPAPATPPAASANVKDEDVTKFAKAVITLSTIQNDASVASADKRPKMIAALQQSGLDPQTFNSIAQAAETDPALQQRIQTAIAASQPAQPPQ